MSLAASTVFELNSDPDLYGRGLSVAMGLPWPWAVFVPVRDLVLEAGEMAQWMRVPGQA